MDRRFMETPRNIPRRAIRVKVQWNVMGCSMGSLTELSKGAMWKLSREELRSSSKVQNTLKDVVSDVQNTLMDCRSTRLREELMGGLPEREHSDRVKMVSKTVQKTVMDPLDFLVLYIVLWFMMELSHVAMNENSSLLSMWSKPQHAETTTRRYRSRTHQQRSGWTTTRRRKPLTYNVQSPSRSSSSCLSLPSLDVSKADYRRY